MYPTVKLFLAGGRIDTIHSAVSYCDHCEHHLGHGIYYVCCNAADMWTMFDNVRNEEYKTQRSAFSWWQMILLPMILRLGATPASTPIFRLRAALRVHIWHSERPPLSSYIWCWKRAPLSTHIWHSERPPPAFKLYMVLRAPPALKPYLAFRAPPRFQAIFCVESGPKFSV